MNGRKIATPLTGYGISTIVRFLENLSG